MNRQALHAGAARLAVLLALLPCVLAVTCLKASSGPTEPEDGESPEHGDPQKDGHGDDQAAATFDPCVHELPSRSS